MYIDIGCTDTVLEAGHVLDGETMPENTLFFGDNLDVLRRYIPDESVDLIYLDPPFQSGQDYNVLFEDQDGTRAAAQIKAFEDTWRWDEAAAAAYKEVVDAGGDVSRVMQAFREFIGTNDLLAYLSMMAPRLKELRRVLKPTGSIYLHCDPTASHYLKLLMDAVFEPEHFLNEIVWERTTPKGLMSKSLPTNHDVLLAYGASDATSWNEDEMFVPYDPDDLPESIDKKYSKIDENGRRYQLTSLLNPNKDRPNLEYEFLGVTRVWRWTEERMRKAYEEGKVVQPSPGAVPRQKRYLDEQRGMPLGDVWTDIPPINAQAAERLGYPTQKPEDLLKRIIKLSTNEDDVVLDPFCGCGTTIAAAEHLDRRWVGIDITYQAISLIKRRLRDAFGEGVDFDVVGEPVSLPDAKRLAEHDRHQFELWALDLVDARMDEKKKGADKGIDGRLYFHDPAEDSTVQIIISVKSGKTGPKHVRDLRGVVDREGAEIGVLITLQEPTKKMREEAASAGFYESRWGNHPRIQLFTVEELLDGATIDRPRLTGADRTFKEAPKAERAEPTKQEDLDLDAAGEGDTSG